MFPLTPSIGTSRDSKCLPHSSIGRAGQREASACALPAARYTRGGRPGLKAKATITKVQLVKAAEIFKDKAKDPEQELYAIHGRVNDREMRIATFTKPFSEEISPKSRLAQFKQRYKHFPKLGMRVDVVTDDNGYWKIVL